MKRVASVLLFAIAAAGWTEDSAITLRSLELGLSGDTLETVIEVRGVQGADRLLSRMVQEFDPSYQSLELLDARFGVSGGTLGPVPGWAVDTLSGRSGTLSLVIAWPALRDGMEIRYRLRMLDWGGTWSRGPWVVVPPGMGEITPDSTVVGIRGTIPGDIDWEGECYDLRTSGGGMEFTASHPSDTLWFSPFLSWGELEDFIVSEADSVLSGPFPPDLREAALQTTAAGADPWMQLRLARSLICNSMELAEGSGKDGPFTTRGLQEILDSRRGTPLEHAVLLAAMCRELGLNADVLPATRTRQVLPVPWGWERFLVRAGHPDDGPKWLLEPSAYLSHAFYVHRPDTLFVLENGFLHALAPAGAETNTLREDWTIDPGNGTFRVSVETRGWFDRILRRTSAGMTATELNLMLSVWTWKSGRQVAPSEVWVTDPYDLGVHSGMEARGTWTFQGEGGNGIELLPMLDWDLRDSVDAEIVRTWRLPGSAALDPSSGLISVEMEGDTTLLILEGRCDLPPAVLVEASL